MVFLGDAPPMFMASDSLSANAIAGIVCSTPASVAAFVEHAYQEALAIIEQSKPVVLVLANRARYGELVRLPPICLLLGLAAAKSRIGCVGMTRWPVRSGCDSFFRF